jgi:CsoR family transcriptional regulator, copper-sensing transcriptional repressor
MIRKAYLLPLSLDRNTLVGYKDLIRGNTLQGYMQVMEGDMGGVADKKISARVKRVIGQVAGIERMLEEKRYCVDILNQIAAVRSALDALGVELLTRHLEMCVLGHGSGSEHESAKRMTQQELLDEVKITVSRFLK